MSRPPPPLGEKFALAIIFWLIATFFSIPLQDLAHMLFATYCDGSLPGALLETILKPAGTIFGLMLLFMLRAEDGIGAIISYYWPALLIASAFTALFLWWWRRS
jgi:hypothetical protein